MLLFCVSVLGAGRIRHPVEIVMLLFCVSVLGAGRLYHPGGDRSRCHGRYIQGQRKLKFYTLFLIKNTPCFTVVIFGHKMKLTI